MNTLLKTNDLIKDLPAHISVDANLIEALNKMIGLNLKNLAVLNSTCNILAVVSKQDLFKYVKNKNDRQKLETIKISEILDKNKQSIMAYAESDIEDVFSIMNSLNMTFLPVAKAPWNKRLIGFIEKKEILMALGA